MSVMRDKNVGHIVIRSYPYQSPHSFTAYVDQTLTFKFAMCFKKSGSS